MRDIDDTKAPLLDHLIELRTRLLRSTLALAAAFAIGFYFSEQIYGLLLQPLKQAGQTKLIFGIFEGFFTQVKVAFFFATMVAFPFMATQLWRFIAPGLYRHEKEAFLPFLLLSPFLFVAGASLAYFVAMPLALRFLLSYHSTVGGVTQEALPGVGNYLSFAMTFLFGFGAAFQMPVVLLILERAGIVTRAQLVAWRRYAIVGSTALAAVLTPPDIFSMLLLAVPLVLLYEFALLIMLVTGRRRKKPEAQNAQPS